MNMDEKAIRARMDADPCPSDLQLDGFWLAGRPPDHPLRAHLESCPDCRERLIEYERVHEVFDHEVFPDTKESVAERLARRGLQGLFRTRLAIPVLAASAALVLLVAGAVLMWPGKEHAKKPPGETIGIKGPIGLQVFCRRGQQTFQAHHGDTLLADDRIRFVISSPGSGYVMIVSVDERGRVGRYYPTHGPAARTAGLEQELPGSVALDRSRGKERIFALFSPGPFDFQMVREDVEAGLGPGANLETLERLPVELSQTSLLFVKGAR